MIPHLDGYHPPGCTCHPCVDSQPKPVRHRWARTWISTGPRRGPNGCSPEPCQRHRTHLPHHHPVHVLCPVQPSLSPIHRRQHKMTPERLDEIGEAVERADSEVAQLCAGSRRWTMSIPPRDGDSDLVFTALSDAVDELLAYVDELTGERDRARDLAVRSGVFQDMRGLTPEEF